MKKYGRDVCRLLTSPERKLFQRLDTPRKIQDYLDTLPVNFEQKGQTYMSPRRVIRERKAHCFEGALFAAAALAFHGQKPLLMDFRTIPEDEDHVVALFRQNGYWGAISKTNHGILRYRDPVYETPRELAMSYFHEYLMRDGRKSLHAFSRPFDLSRFSPKRWVAVEEELHWLVDRLDESRHFPAVPRTHIRLLRKASRIELRIMDILEWERPRKHR
jgi:hypothetical protein